MPRTSKWGNETIKNDLKGLEVKQQILDKLIALGESRADGAGMKNEDFHALNVNWQPFSARSFALELNRMKKLHGKWHLQLFSLVVLYVVSPHAHF